MLKVILPLFLTTAATALAAEKHFDFTQLPTGSAPSNFVSAITGNGAPGTWRVIEHEGKRALTQMDLETIDEHFPVFLYDREIFEDFTVTVHFKIVGGTKDQRAGIVLRAKDERSYYCISVSALGNNAKFVSFVGGLRGKLFGNNLKVTRDEWHGLSIQCEGNKIYSFLDGKALLPTITDTAFIKGKIGLWTKSDSQVLFSDLHIEYTPHLPFAQALVKETMEKFPNKKLLGIKLYVPQSSDKPRVIAATDPKDMNQEGGDYEIKTFKGANGFCTKSKKLIELTLPLRDRNGEVAAVVKIAMKPFPGETQDAAWGRCKPIQEAMEDRLQGVNSLLE
ncbi:MAG: family 16 glycoside hydrolase [Limisphaerales bacterium]